MGIPKVSTYTTLARFTFGGGSIGGVRYAADIEVGIPGRRGTYTAFVPGADILALLRKGASMRHLEASWSLRGLR